MTTNRTPIQRAPATRISKHAVALYARLIKLEAEGKNDTDAEYAEAHNALGKMLGVNKLHYRSIMSVAPNEPPPPWMTIGDQRDNFKFIADLRAELEAALLLKEQQ